MLAALTVIIAMMIGVMYLLKKYLYQSPAAINGNTMIRIISTSYLSPKNSILLVEVLGQVILLGISYNQMSILGNITNHEALENLKNLQLKQKSPPVSDTVPRYKSLFRNISRMRKGM